jgi:CheY-like chemotaxis protein
MDAACPRRILVVDANADVRESLCKLLGLMGYESRDVGNGQDGLEQVIAWQPDIAILAIKLPGLDGWSLARQLRQDPRTAGTRLIALTGYGLEEDREQSLEAGFDFHLAKPCDPDELKQVLTAD